MNLSLLKRAVTRNLGIQTMAPYARLIQTLAERDDVWAVSMGTLIQWWQRRSASHFQVTVSDGVCHITSDLADVILEVYPGDLQVSQTLTTPCSTSDFAGPVWITIDATLRHKELFKEALRREGILNFTEGANGPFFFSTEVSPILEKMSQVLNTRDLSDFHQGIEAIRQLVLERLAQRGIPLVRVWYYPYVDGKLIKVVFSTRYDVDRAIVNMPKIWELEQQYHVTSTAHLRPLGPFYTQRAIKKMSQHPLCTEIAVHGEFMGHAAQFGGVLEAAVAEKRRLEEITGREVLGMSLHGGELLDNLDDAALAVTSPAGFLYDVSKPPASYYFPYHQENADETLETAYRVHFTFGDIIVEHTQDYAEEFFQQTMEQFELVRAQHGIFVLMLHPIYFDLWNYLLNIGNLLRLVGFLPTYVKRWLSSR